MRNEFRPTPTQMAESALIAQAEALMGLKERVHREVVNALVPVVPGYLAIGKAQGLKLMDSYPYED